MALTGSAVLKNNNYTFNPKQLLPFVDVFFIIFVLCIFSKQLETMKWNLIQL